MQRDYAIQYHMRVKCLKMRRSHIGMNQNDLKGNVQRGEGKAKIVILNMGLISYLLL